MQWRKQFEPGHDHDGRQQPGKRRRRGVRHDSGDGWRNQYRQYRQRHQHGRRHEQRFGHGLRCWQHGIEHGHWHRHKYRQRHWHEHWHWYQHWHWHNTDTHTHTNTNTNTGPASTTAVANSPDVATYHNDIARTGQHLNETALTPATVNSANFGKLAVFPVDGPVDAEPLYLAGVKIAGGTHNVLYVATENASVYALDADTGATLWHTTTLGAGETPSDRPGCPQITPKIGITATPVIDRSRGPNGAMYVVGDVEGRRRARYHQRVHALDVTTGAELFGGPTEIAASLSGQRREQFERQRHIRPERNTPSASRCCS